MRKFTRTRRSRKPRKVGCHTGWDSVKEAEAALKYQELQTREQIRQAQANLAAAEAQKGGADADLENARLNFKRLEDLYGKREVSAQAYDQVRTAFDAAKAHVEALEKQVDAAKANGIEIATVTETLAPAVANFQDWQVGQLQGLQAALARVTAHGPLLGVSVDAPEPMAHIARTPGRPPELLDRWLVANTIHAIARPSRICPDGSRNGCNRAGARSCSRSRKTRGRTRASSTAA